MLEACGLRGSSHRRCADLPRHANFIENAGGATTAEAIALMAEARRRALEQYGVTLEHEVELLGALELPPWRRPRRQGRRRGRRTSVRGDSSRAPVPPPAAARHPPSRLRAASICRASCRRRARSSPGSRCSLSGMIAFAVARQSSIFAIRSIEVVGAKPALEREVRDALQPLVGTSLVALDGDQVQKRLDALPQIRRASYDRAFPNTLRVVVEPDLPAAVLRSGPDGWLISEYGAVLQSSRGRSRRTCRASGSRRRTRRRLARTTCRGRSRVALRGLAEARRVEERAAPADREREGGHRRSHARAALRCRAAPRRRARPGLKLAVANRFSSAQRRRTARSLPRRQLAGPAGGRTEPSTLR